MHTDTEGSVRSSGGRPLGRGWGIGGAILSDRCILAVVPPLSSLFVNVRAERRPVWHWVWSIPWGFRDRLDSLAAADAVPRRKRLVAAAYLGTWRFRILPADNAHLRVPPTP